MGVAVLSAVFDPTFSARDFVTFSRDMLSLRYDMPIMYSIYTN